MRCNKSGFTPLEMMGDLNQSNVNTFERVKTKRRKKFFLSLTGFTLIEITIALLILAIGLVGLLALFPVGFDAAGKASNIITATFLGQELIEDIKREGYNGSTLNQAVTETAKDSSPDHGYPNPNSGYGEYFSSPYANYESIIFAWDGILKSGSPVRVFQDSIREVKVVVFWPYDAASGPPAAKQRKVELQTYIANYE